MAFDNAFNTTSPGSAVGNREDLSAMTSVLYADTAPVSGLARKTKAGADLVEWTVDTHKAPDKDKALKEGEDISSFDGKFSNLARLQNRLQHTYETFGVTRKQQVLQSVTPVDLQHAEEKALVDAMLDREAAIVSDNAAVTGSSSSKGISRGLGKFIQSTAQSDDVNDVPAAYRPGSAALNTDGAAITESSFNGIVSSVWANKGTTSNLVCVADYLLRDGIASTFTRIGGDTSLMRYTGSDGSEIQYGVDIFKSSYGPVSIINSNPNCSPAGATADRGYVFDASLLEIAEALPMGSQELQDEGGGGRGFVDCMWSLKVLNPLGFGKIV